MWLPGETEADFNETLALLDQVERDSACYFISPRPTEALASGSDSRRGKTGGDIVQERRAFRLRNAGRSARAEVLVEGGTGAGQWIGVRRRIAR